MRLRASTVDISKSLHLSRQSSSINVGQICILGPVTCRTSFAVTRGTLGSVTWRTSGEYNVLQAVTCPTSRTVCMPHVTPCNILCNIHTHRYTYSHLNISSVAHLPTPLLLPLTPFTAVCGAKDFPQNFPLLWIMSPLYSRSTSRTCFGRVVGYEWSDGRWWRNDKIRLSTRSIHTNMFTYIHSYIHVHIIHANKFIHIYLHRSFYLYNINEKGTSIDAS